MGEKGGCPKNQLQLEEVDSARFMYRGEAVKYIMPSQNAVIQNLTSKGLI
jgi:hypothetical protein